VTTDWNPSDPDATRVVYDLSSWNFDQQAELAAELAEAEIPHAWEGTDLLVPEEFEDAADSVVDTVEIRLGIVYSDEPEELNDDPDAQPIDITEGEPTTEYDLGDWPDIERDAITRALTRQGHPFRWDAGVLLVHTTDEEVVEALLDMVEDGEIGSEAALEEMDDDWSEEDRLPFETLTVFFLAGERLRRDPLDADGLEQLQEAIELAEPEHPPFGVEMRLWQRTCELADDLAGALVDDEIPDEEAARQIATELHDLLRPFI
jgi:hypothetical protein